MKVLNLQCAYQHAFEGWFGSEDDFQSQLARGLIECPLCSDCHITKLPTAPRLNLGGYSASKNESDKAEQPKATAPSEPSKELSPGSPLPVNQSLPVPLASAADQGLLLKALRHVMEHTENVGSRFAEEARRMHYGDAEQRSIRGQTSTQEALELLDEGIEVMALPLPVSLKETLQ